MHNTFDLPAETIVVSGARDACREATVHFELAPSTAIK